MRTWSALFNFVGLLILLLLVMILQKDLRDIERDFNETRLRYVVDYATEAAFQSSLESGNIGISYQDLQNVKITPDNILETFKSVVMLSYDMSFSDENFESLDKYITSAVLATSDGYYIASLEEVDTDNTDIQGGEYALKWGLKKPYVIQYGSNKYVAYNISSESWVYAEQVGDELTLTRGEKFSDLSIRHTIGATRQDILTAVNKRISEDINYNITNRNEMFTQNKDLEFIYLPSSESASGVNSITKPSLLITLQGADFSGTQRVEATSVGGFTVSKKRRVLGFEKDGVKYYCYESQIPENELVLVEKFFNTVDEAALNDYRPHLDYLRKPLEN